MTSKILYVVYSLEVGGLERIVVDLANSLDTRRYEPFICCISAAGELSEFFERRENMYVIGNAGRISAKSCRAVYDIAKSNAIDVIHSHNLSGLLHGLPASKLLGIPLVHTNHGYVEEERRKRRLRMAEFCACRLATAYVCVSKNLKREAAKRLRMRNAALEVIYNGVVDPPHTGSRRPAGKEGVVIGSIGRLDPIKNYRFLIEAFSEVAALRRGCRLELIGGGSQYNELMALRDELHLRDKVIFHGRVLKPREHLMHVDIFALTSLSEGLSISILEAMSMRKICVVSKVGGNTEIIEDGVNGYLFEPNDKHAFVEKLLELVDHIDSEQSERIREAAGVTIQRRFSLDAMRNGYCRLYDKLTAAAGA